MDKEPIIYKSNTYINSKDIDKILEGEYKVVIQDDGLELEYIGNISKKKDTFVYNEGANVVDKIGKNLM